MTYHLSISNHGVYKQINLTSAEYEKAHKLCKDRTNMAGPLKSSFIPIRTDADYLLSDLVFPTLINAVIKTDDKARHTFAFIAAALVWDIMTFPVRLMTLIPRMIYNACCQSKKAHPIIAFLREKGLILRQNQTVTFTCRDGNLPATVKKALSRMPLGNNDLYYDEGDPIRLALFREEVDVDPSIKAERIGDKYLLHMSNNREVPSFDFDNFKPMHEIELRKGLQEG